MDKQALENMNLEETLESVDNVLSKLSSDELPLEESFSLYKDGMELLNHCNEVIDRVEKQIINLRKEEEA